MSAETTLEIIIQRAIRAPVVWSLVFAAPLALVWALAARVKLLPATARTLWGALVLVGASVLVLYAWISGLYLSSCWFMDHCEPTIASLAWYFWNGREIYPAPGTPYFGFQYGPYLYILNGILEASAGPSILAAKLGGVLAGLGALALTYALVRRTCTRTVALLMTAVFAAMQLHFSYFSFIRADSFLVLFVSVACLAATLPTRWTIVLVGLFLGISVNLKIHAFIYFLPILAYVKRAVSVRQALAIMAIGCATWMAPFVVFGNISFPNYMLALSKAVLTHGLDPNASAGILKWLCLLGTPLGLAFALAYLQEPEQTRAALKKNWGLLFVLALSLAATTLPASKHGAGPHHFMPFLPVIVLTALGLYRDGVRFQRFKSKSIPLEAWLASYLACLFLFAGFQLRSMKWAVESNSPGWAELAAEIQGVVQRFGKTHAILMGQAEGPTGGGQYELTYLRTMLVFAGMPIGFEPPPLMDAKRAGLDTPRLDDFPNDAKEKPLLWMIPKGGKPFALMTWYPPYDHLYDEPFRRDFLSRYGLSGHTPHFDLYTIHFSDAIPRI